MVGMNVVVYSSAPDRGGASRIVSFAPGADVLGSSASVTRWK
jgi:hypothetical protein